MKANSWTEGAVLPLLSLLLVGVFCLSVSMYDVLCTAGENGALAVFASEVFHLANETVPENEADIAAMAEEYIARYNAIYRDLQ